MRIYTEVVWSWDDEKGELVRESSKSYDYDGPLTLAQRSHHPSEMTGANYTSTYSAGYSYPKGVGGNSSEYPHYIRFIAKRSYTSTQSARGTSNGEVALYMPPDALKTSYTQGIGDVEMGGFIKLATGGGAGGAGAELAAGAFGEAGQSGMEAFNIIKGNVLGNPTKVMAGVAKAAAGGALKKFAGTTGGQAVSKATGQILNPHKAVVYQGPGGFRTFSYTFVMVPKSPDEAEEIFNIVKFFKLRMHPGTGGGAGINNLSSVTLTYPDEFEIKYYVNGQLADGSNEITPLFNIHNCFMESFAADYTTSGLTSFMDDEQPLTTTMTLSFKETQLLTKADIDAGY